MVQPAEPATLIQAVIVHNPDAAWQRITADTFITRGPILLYGVVLSSDNVGAADAALYEGRNTSGRLLFTMRAPQTQTTSVIWATPIHLADGLYIDVGSNVGDVFILYAHLREA